MVETWDPVWHELISGSVLQIDSITILSLARGLKDGFDDKKRRRETLESRTLMSALTSALAAF